MTGQCRRCEAPTRRPAGRIASASASVLPGALLVLLPKCPLCLAAWLTAATGIGVSEAAATRVRGLILIVWVVAAAFATALAIRHRSARRVSFPPPLD